MTRKGFLAALAAPFLARFFPKPKLHMHPAQRLNLFHQMLDTTSSIDTACDIFQDRLNDILNLQRDQIERSLNPPAV